MSRFIACYDLNEANSPHYEFLEAARPLGWEGWILSSSNEWNRLPNTTLVGDFASMEEAVNTFKAIKPAAEKKLGAKITLEKWIVAHYTTATFASDKKVPKS
ncbi:hypothetical protein [Sinorhizobium alkalisoli]|uniref:hypothetical protein n=1 Tax=Sinorhizobium alkalisoli TaxID=1752398 RepID=UPI00124E9642|nr:hypothetical protein [Sinorhizobium alkalisoli]